jgi:hypothetical protein
MQARDPDPTEDISPDDLVAYLAKRLGVSDDVALSTLGDWLLDFEPTHVLPERVQKHR